MRVAIQGEPGSNSHLAVKAMLGDCELVPCAISAEVFESLSSGNADAAVLPIENSLHGAVADHYDLLLEHDVRIVAEAELRIHHALIGLPGAQQSGLKRVLSHPVALSQCRRFFQEHPHLQAVPAYDTAGSVKKVVARGDATSAAIAAPYAAEVYGGEVLRSGLEDDLQNFTRFLHLQRTGDAPARLSRSQEAKMSLAFSIPHRPGSLVRVLQRLAESGADLTRIESRPVPGRPWEYVFFLDLRVSNDDAGFLVEHVLQRECSMVKLLGVYAISAARSGVQ